MFMSSSSDEFTFSSPTSKAGDGILGVPQGRAGEHVSCQCAKQTRSLARNMLARATILRVYGSSPVADPGEGARGPASRYDPPLQSNNRKFLLVSGRRIGFFRLGRQILQLYNKALEICIKHEKEKSRSGPESWRDFWHIIIFFHLPVSGLNPINVFLFHSSPGLFPKKMAFSRLSFF